jgi:hypothetical protein
MAQVKTRTILLSILLEEASAGMLIFPKLFNLVIKGATLSLAHRGCLLQQKILIVQVFYQQILK